MVDVNHLIFTLLFICVARSESFSYILTPSNGDDDLEVTKLLFTTNNNSFLIDLKMLNKLGLLRTKLNSKMNMKQLSETKTKEEERDVKKKDQSKHDYAHFYDPRNIKFYFTDSHKYPLDHAAFVTYIESQEEAVDDIIIESEVEKAILDKETDGDDVRKRVNIRTNIPYPVWIDKNSSHNLISSIKRVEKEKQRSRAKTSQPHQISKKKPLKTHPTKIRSPPTQILKWYPPRPVPAVPRLVLNLRKFLSSYKQRLSRSVQNIRRNYFKKIPSKYFFEISAFMASLMIILFL